MKNELNVVYKYFSHHLRNCTAMIAASVTLMSYKMVPEENDLLAEVIEASFLLDLFDAGMNICFNHMFDEPAIGMEDIYPLEGAVSNFIDRTKAMFHERGVNVKFYVSSPSTVYGNAHELKTITSIIIYEMMLQASTVISIELNTNELNVVSDGFQYAPPVWETLKDLLKSRGVEFAYGNTFCKLRFSV